jgi:hypothetical protein
MALRAYRQMRNQSLNPMGCAKNPMGCAKIPYQREQGIFCVKPEANRETNWAEQGIDA